VDDTPTLIEYAAKDGSLHTIEPNGGKVTVDADEGYDVAASFGLEVDVEASRAAIAEASEDRPRQLYEPAPDDDTPYSELQARAKALGIPASGSRDALAKAIAKAEAAPPTTNEGE
jgi:hypothetical protein